MNELREAIFEEVYAGRNGDVYEDCYEATDRILALIADAMLSDDVITAACVGLSKSDAGYECSDAVDVYGADALAVIESAIAAAGLTNDPA